jgi:hypothetical protein
LITTKNAIKFSRAISRVDVESNARVSYPEDGDKATRRNVGILFKINTADRPRKYFTFMRRESIKSYITTKKTARHPEDHNSHFHRRENFNSHEVVLYTTYRCVIIG